MPERRSIDHYPHKTCNSKIFSHNAVLYEWHYCANNVVRVTGSLLAQQCWCLMWQYIVLFVSWARVYKNAMVHNMRFMSISTFGALSELYSCSSIRLVSKVTANLANLTFNEDNCRCAPAGGQTIMNTHKIIQKWHMIKDFQLRDNWKLCRDKWKVFEDNFMVTTRSRVAALKVFFVNESLVMS